MIDHSEDVASFVAITGTASHVALHYLEACGFDVARSVDFYFQHPPDPHGAPQPQEDNMDVMGAHAGHVTAVEGAGYMDDDDEVGREGADRGRSYNAPIADLTGGDDDELQRALAASMNQSGRNCSLCRPEIVDAEVLRRLIHESQCAPIFELRR